MLLRPLLAAAVLGVAFPSFGQTQPDQPPAPSSTPPSPMQTAREQVRKACAADIKTYCDDAQGGRPGQCLQAHADKLSPDCKDAIEQMRALWRDRRPQ